MRSVGRGRERWAPGQRSPSLAELPPAENVHGTENRLSLLPEGGRDKLLRVIRVAISVVAVIGRGLRLRLRLRGRRLRRWGRGLGLQDRELRGERGDPRRLRGLGGVRLLPQPREGRLCGGDFLVLLRDLLPRRLLGRVPLRGRFLEVSLDFGNLRVRRGQLLTKTLLRSLGLVGPLFLRGGLLCSILALSKHLRQHLLIRLLLCFQDAHLLRRTVRRRRCKLILDFREQLLPLRELRIQLLQLSQNTRCRRLRCRWLNGYP